MVASFELTVLTSDSPTTPTPTSTSTNSSPTPIPLSLAYATKRRNQYAEILPDLHVVGWYLAFPPHDGANGVHSAEGGRGVRVTSSSPSPRPSEAEIRVTHALLASHLDLDARSFLHLDVNPPPPPTCVHLPVTLRHIVTWDHTATTSETTTTTTTMTAPDPFLPVTLHSSPAERVAVAEVSKVSVTGEGGEVAVHLQQLGSAMRVLARNLGTLVDHVRAVARGEISASSCPEVLRGVAGLVNQLPHVARVEGGPGREMRAAVLTALLPVQLSAVTVGTQRILEITQRTARMGEKGA